MVLLRRYPFATTLKEYSVRVAGVEIRLSDLAKDEAVASLALKRLKANIEEDEYRPEPESTVDDEVFSFHLAVALATALGPSALRRFSESEASRARKMLKLEDENTLIELASSLEVRVEKKPISIPWLVARGGEVRRKILAYRVHVSDYLKVHAAGEREEALTNSFLLGGWVYLDRQDLEDLIHDAVRLRIETLARQVDPSELPEEILARARVVFEEALDKRSGRLADLDPDAFPPCISAIIEKASRAGVKALSDQEGYMLVTFLAYTKLDLDSLRDLLNAGDGDALAVSSLARFARSRGFRPFKCSAAKDAGLCKWNCRGPSPLSEYRRRLARSSHEGPEGVGRGA